MGIMVNPEEVCNIESWKVSELVGAVKEPTKKKKINVPDFQRSLVWKDSQKTEFIDSIKKGYPFGSILVYQGEVEGEVINYQLIDGLQRTNTLKDYMGNPTDFFKRGDISDRYIDVLTAEFDLDIEDEEIRASIADWVRDLEGFEGTEGCTAFRLTKHLLEKIDELGEEDLDTIVELFEPFIVELKEESDISDIEIPVIVYTGDKANLPDIFERLNSKGTKLSKYQIYAAAWKHTDLEIANRDIIDLLKKRYDEMLDEGFTIRGYDPSENIYTSSFTLFEYLFGLGKLLSKEHPDLFGYPSDPDKAESAGFNLYAVCAGLHLKDMGKLSEKYEQIDTEKFEECVLDATTIVSDMLRPFIGMRANKKNSSSSSPLVVHSEYQIVSLIGKIFHSKYDIESDLQVRDEWSETKDALLDNLPYHYLYDILREYWRGTGDKKIDELIQEGSRYEKELTKDNWETAFEEWFTPQMLKKEKKRVSIGESEILFFKYIYTHIMSNYEDQSREEYEIEHLVPVSQLKDIAEPHGIPISAVSNLALIPKDINQDKGDKTLYEFFDDQVEEGVISEEQAETEIEELERYTFTERGDFEFVSDLNEDDYRGFLEERFELLKEKFYAKNDID